MSFGQSILDAFASFGDRPAVEAGNAQLTYAQLLEQLGNIADNLHANGIRNGDRVGLAQQDNIDTVLSVLACWRIGATPVIIDFRAPASQRARFARDFALKVVFESRALAAAAEPYPNSLFDREWRFASPSAHFDGPVDCSNPAFLTFSSGTTGDPKAYVQTHEALAGRVAERKRVMDADRKRFLTPMTLTYSATRHQVFGYLLNGGTIRFTPPLFSPSELIEALLSFKASGTALPPPVIARLAKEAGARVNPLFPDLAVLYSVGGPAPAEQKVAAYRHLTPGYRISYASSLTGMVAILAGEDVLRKPETTGRAVSGVRIDILSEDGELLPAGERGLIRAWTKTLVSAVLLPGNRPFVDPKTMSAEWGIPGDIGYLDEEGFLTIVDRDADMIVRGGVNVAPQELEKLIRGHPKVREVAVAGFPDEIMGQEIAAFVVADKGLTADELVVFLRESVSPERRPRVVRLVPSLPYNDHGKLLRRNLIESFLRETGVAGATKSQ